MIRPLRHMLVHFIGSLAIDSAQKAGDVPVKNNSNASATGCAVNMSSQDHYVLNGSSTVPNGSSMDSWSNSFYNSSINDS